MLYRNNRGVDLRGQKYTSLCKHDKRFLLDLPLDQSRHSSEYGLTYLVRPLHAIEDIPLQKMANSAHCRDDHLLDVFLLHF